MKPNGRLKEGKAIGICNYEYHRGDLTWEMINSEKCLQGQCDHFSWISFKDRDNWLKENADNKRSYRQRADAAKKRAINKKLCQPTPVELFKRIEKINKSKPLTIKIKMNEGLCFYSIAELDLYFSGINLNDIKICMLDYAESLRKYQKLQPTSEKELILKELYILYKLSRSKYIQFLKLEGR